MDACQMLGVLSLNSIFAADRVLVSISADYLAFGVQARWNARSGRSSMS